MKNIIIYTILLLLAFSCNKKEPIVIEKEGFFITYNCSENQQLVPSVASATINDSVIIISGKYINNTDGNCIKSMDFSIITDNIQKGTTYFNANSPINQRYVYLQENNLLTNSYKVDNDAYDYLNITEIDRDNKTVSGKFSIFLINGYFDKLDYTNEIDTNFLLYSAKIRLSAEDDILNISGKYQTNNVYLNNNRLEIYLNDDLSLEFNFDCELGTHHLYSDNNFLVRIKNQINNTYYKKPSGEYVVSDTLIYNHNYKKIIIETDLVEAFINGNFSSRILTIDNTEILLY